MKILSNLFFQLSRDEPTVGVDPVLREIIWNHLENQVRNKNTTVVITTHYLAEAEKSNKVCFMRDGKTLLEGKPQEVMRNFQVSNLEAVFYNLCEKQDFQQDWKPLLHEGIGPFRDPKIYRKFSFGHFKALILKDWINARRHFGFLAFQV